MAYDPLNPRGSDRPWRLWYGDCVAGCKTQILLYADSKDGYSWDKPDLGIVNLSEVRPDLAALGTHNNILMKGGGIGV